MGALDSVTKRALDAGVAWTQRYNVNDLGDHYYVVPAVANAQFLTAAPDAGNACDRRRHLGDL